MLNENLNPQKQEDRMKSRVILLVILLFSLLSFTHVFAEIPRMINYQGKITTPQGALVDTTVSMVFTIYDDSTTGSVLWADTQYTVVVEKGIFNVLLGSSNPIPDSVFTGGVRYLGIKVGADAEMTPRKGIVSVAYAYTDGDWIVSGNNLYRPHGNVGIGIDNPLTSLYVYKDTNEFVGISIENPNTQSNSCEGIYFWNEDIGVAGIRLFDQGHASYAGRMNMFNNRPVGSIHFGTAGQLSRMTVANDGNVGIGTTEPGSKLDVRGDIKLGPSGELHCTSGPEKLKIIRGTVWSDGTIEDGTSFSVQRTSTGTYKITPDTPFAAVPTVSSNIQLMGTYYWGSMYVKTYYADYFIIEMRDTSGTLRDCSFSFIAVGPR